MLNTLLKVSSLITPQGEWDLQLLNEVFPPCDVIRICSFPPAVELSDKLVWAYTRDGNYSVKSGNWLLTHEHEVVEFVEESTKRINAVKEKVWGLHTAPKIKLFFWRVLSGAVAVSECLHRHGINSNPLCQACKVEEETISHVLFGCQLAQQVWSVSGLPVPDNGFFPTTVENMEFCFMVMSQSEVPLQSRQAIPWLLWEIWKARNDLVFAQRVSDPHILWVSAKDDMLEWCQQQESIASNDAPDGRRIVGIGTRWCKPAIGKLKCNVHSFWINGSSFCGGAWILRNHIGDVLYHARDAFLPRVNRIASELSCILWSLCSLRDMRFSSCEVWMDCHAAWEAISNPRAWPKYRSQTTNIWQVVRVMREVSFHLSSPKANVLAKEIACSVTRDGRLTSYLALGGPVWLQDRIERDKSLGD
ncbi:hypothetical protein CARUB_v10025338mg [Capsella rubella]|uniref:Reverse transcriptase zinc-binding domain-containing protein n=1 Tax=Capsella rubella TaxID=81985 RepID=R0G1H0_9BRAS|nr:hypothetical protein CARUB_v10025338mg [Capsella rubella]